ncbi:helix-hairpin-helix domain-containing protein [Companilactobacillus sp. DQM5]|uniref:helix-hairpin-helix domain-containing protein n=1 Tax=Companilactobacillus sp. DQM5 TaxID=3463359 RepID=UPI004059D271
MIDKIKEKVLEKKIEYAIIIILIIILISGIFVLKQKPAVQTSQNENVFKENIKHKKTQKVQKNDSEQIYVDIQGEVNRPGFYRLKSNSRVFDLLQLAGGLKETADLKNVNQAKKISDQEQVYIPKVGENMQNSNQKENVASIDENTKKQQVNINTADVSELQKLTGVGPKKAEQIVQFREENGGFKKLEDLTKVSGIGEKTLETLKEQIMV